jgi:hypothetical protein
LTSHVKNRAVMAAVLENEIRIIEEARDALPDDSHLRALCSLAAERLGAFVSQPKAIAKSQGKTRRAGGQEPASQIGLVTSNKKGRLAGTIRRSSIASM